MLKDFREVLERDIPLAAHELVEDLCLLTREDILKHI